MSRPAPAPPSDGPLRDLRRGAIRSLPFAIFAALLLFADVALGLVWVTFCFGWIPLTLLEGLTERRARSRLRYVLAVLGVWLGVGLGTFGLTLQGWYVHGLLAGRGPGQALGSIDAQLDMALFVGACPFVAVTAAIFGAHLLARCFLERRREHELGPWLPILLATLLQATCAAGVIGSLQVAAGVLDGDRYDGLAVLFMTFALVWAATWVGMELLVWVTTRLDRFEARIWPPEAA